MALNLVKYSFTRFSSEKNFLYLTEENLSNLSNLTELQAGNKRTCLLLQVRVTVFRSARTYLIQIGSNTTRQGSNCFAFFSKFSISFLSQLKRLHFDNTLRYFSSIICHATLVKEYRLIQSNHCILKSDLAKHAQKPR